MNSRRDVIVPRGTDTRVDAGWDQPAKAAATARVVPADEALRIGLAAAAVPTADLDATVADLAAALVAPMPGVVAETKALLQGAADRDLDEQRRLEREAQVRRFRAVAAAFA